MSVSLNTLPVQGYVPHSLHTSQRDWTESNCYVDLYVEVLNALGVCVEACLPFTLATDFEGDQWTFFKPPLRDLDKLYGLDVQELTLWRPLHEHLTAQVAQGRVVAPEVDSFFLPDTSATDYRTAHVKTTIAVTQIDIEKKTLSYFHNAGYFSLSGEDFDGVFGLNIERPDNYLPPYCELLKLQRVHQKPTKELVACSLRLAQEHFANRPAKNPLTVYAEQIEQDISWLLEHDLPTYHRYVFANVRQCGANFEFLMFYLKWLAASGVADVAPAAEHFGNISQACKTLILKLARIVNSKKPRSVAEGLRDMSEHWDRGMDLVAPHFQG